MKIRSLTLFGTSTKQSTLRTLAKSGLLSTEIQQALPEYEDLYENISAIIDHLDTMTLLNETNLLAVLKCEDLKSLNDKLLNLKQSQSTKISQGQFDALLGAIKQERSQQITTASLTDNEPALPVRTPVTRKGRNRTHNIRGLAASLEKGPLSADSSTSSTLKPAKVKKPSAAHMRAASRCPSNHPDKKPRRGIRRL